MNYKNGMRPVHPGEVLLEDYIRPAQLDMRELARALKIPDALLLSIIEGLHPVTPALAIRLERRFGSEATGWLGLQTAFDYQFIKTTLLAAVHVRRREHGSAYVVIADIPQPFRTAFQQALRGSQCPMVPDGPSAWELDWQQWVDGDWHDRDQNFPTELCDGTYREALQHVEVLMDAEAGTSQGACLDLLSFLVQKYEAKNFPLV